VISPSQGLYLHRTAQHRETKDKHPCPKRDSNPRSGVLALKAHVATGLDGTYKRKALITVTGLKRLRNESCKSDENCKKLKEFKVTDQKCTV
jgi:hypothetical protein